MDNEISGQTGTHTTAMFWEYDSRLGRRWNVDPKPTVGISDYACFANNPIWFSDILGDTLHTDKTAQSNSDIKSVAGKYASLVNIAVDGNVTINYDLAKSDAKFKNKKGEFNQKKYDRFVSNAKKDIGIQLIEGMANAPENYLYQTSGVIGYIEDGQGYEMDMSTLSGYSEEYNNGLAGIHGFSTEPRRDGNVDRMPIDKNVDGLVFIAKGIYESAVIYETESGARTKEYKRIPRSSMVYHELREIYLRTTHHLSYPEAHSQSIYNEGNHYGNGNPGNTSRASYL